VKRLDVACLGVLVLVGASAEAQTPTIDHQPAACAVAEKFPRMEARFAPPETVAAARVVFQGQSSEWYSVAMKSEGAGFIGVLPKPKKSLKWFRYYLEVTNKALATSRTADYTTAVVDSAGACRGKILAGSLASASVILQGPAGAAALPAGFASAGVVAGSAAGASAGSSAGSAGLAGAAGAAAASGGGLSAAAVVGIVAGAGAAAAGVTVATKGSDKSSSSASLPSPSPSPGSSSTSYTGTFSGQYVVTQTFSSSGPNGGTSTTTCFHAHAYSGTMTTTLQQSSGAVTGQAGISGTDTAVGVSGSPNCSSPGPGGSLFFSCAVTGSAGSFGCSQQTSFTSGGRLNTEMHAFSAVLSGGIISGTVTYSDTGQAPSGMDSSSATFAVTLR
jgi:hypothetical protein